MRTTNPKGSGVTKLDVQTIKNRLEYLFKTNSLVHVSVNSGRTRLTDVPSNITGIYNHFLCVTSKVKNYKEEAFTINFIDILIGKFKIKELTEFIEEENI
jgi:hypothetical protein